MSERSPRQLDDLAGRAAQSMFWALVANLLGRLVSLASLAVLARLLSPTDFGVVAFALVFITYVETAGDLGAAAALIYWPDRREEAARASFWINAAMGTGWFLLTFLFAPALASFFHQPGAAPVLRLMALSFPLKALANTHDALCQKDLRFRDRLAPELAMASVKAAVAVGLGLAGYGVWSLAWGQLAGLAARAAWLWRLEGWRPHGPLPRDLVRPLLAYGRGAVGVNLLAAVVHHADLVVVGRRLGAEALGLYQVAAKLPEMTVALLIWVVARVLFPALAQVQAAPAHLRRMYLGSLRYVALAALPATLTLIVLAQPLATTLFGPRFAGVGPILQGLALYTGLRALGSPTGDVLKAVGRPGLLAGLGALKAAVLLPALVWATAGGTVTVAWTLAAVTAGGSALSLAVGCRLTGARAGELAAAWRASLLPSVALAAVLVACRLLTAGEDSLWTLLASGLAAGVAFLVTLRWREPEIARRLRSLVGPTPGLGAPLEGETR